MPDQAPRRSRRWPGLAWRVVRAPLIAYLVLLLVMCFLEDSFIFVPSGPAEGDWHPPGLVFEEARFQAADGRRLHGWYLPHQGPHAAILFLHGNGGNITHRAEALRMLHDRVGASVLIFDYRGYGRSEGRPSQQGVLADARAARKWLAAREGRRENQLVLLGESLGGAVAVDLAAADGAQALVLESTFTSAPDVAAHHYPWLPVHWLMRTRLDSLSKIAAYHGPLLESHGRPDTIIPFALGRRLFEAANEPKQFFTIPDRDHNDPRPDEYYDALAKFLAKYGG
ncbi:MAG: alpha/beta hydrolase [Thermoguttaceae bacterium]